jgi:hypothetical protein
VDKINQQLNAGILGRMENAKNLVVLICIGWPQSNLKPLRRYSLGRETIISKGFRMNNKTDHLLTGLKVIKGLEISHSID